MSHRDGTAGRYGIPGIHGHRLPDAAPCTPAPRSATASPSAATPWPDTHRASSSSAGVRGRHAAAWSGSRSMAAPIWAVRIQQQSYGRPQYNKRFGFLGAVAWQAMEAVGR